MFRLLTVCVFVIFEARTSLSEGPSVIIVGAGPSGIAAVVRLLENSITNITILEAENRIGGRINTTKFGDEVVDLGAEYCHGEEGNAVYQTVKELDLLEHSHVFEPETNKMYYSNGSRIDHSLSVELDIAITDYSSEIKRTDNVTLEEAFLEFYNTTVLEKYKDDEEKLKLARDALRFAHDLILIHEGSFSWRSPASGRHYAACKGDQMMTWKRGGYQSFLNVLLKGHSIENNTILNNTVERIIWNGDRVRVVSANNRSLEADYVIFTPSIGVLRADRDTLFQPELPERKIAAIDALGFDAVLKIILHFPRRWWKPEDKVFYFVWSSEDLADVHGELSDGPSRDGPPWFTHVAALVAVPSQSNVLTAWVSGDRVPEIEQMTEDVIGKGVVYVAKKFLGNDYNITLPDEVIWSHWYTNPHFRGTFSYEKVKYFTEDISYQEQLAEPLENNQGNPVLFFAGEATHPKIYSTVHGAVDSGRREADRIISLQKKKV